MFAKAAWTKNVGLILILLTSFGFCFAAYASAGEAFIVRIQLYCGRLMEEQTVPIQEAIVVASKEPSLLSLRDKVGAPDNEWKASVIEALSGLMDLRTIEDLFSVQEAWNGNKEDWMERVLGQDAVFRLEASAEKLSPERVTLRIAAFQSKEGAIPEKEAPEVKLRKATEASARRERMDKILDREFSLDVGDPVILCTPWKDGVYFLVVSIARDIPKPKSEEQKEEADIKVVEAPRPVYRVLPFYPEELRRRRIEGTVGLVVAIDKDGNVTWVKVVKPLHPYLDYAAVQAFLGWRFEPAIQNGRPVAAAFGYSYQFDRLADFGPSVWAEEPSDEVSRVLAGAAGYCQKLLSSILDVVCNETIKEIRYRIRPDLEKQQLLFSREVSRHYTNRGVAVVAVGVGFQLMNPRLTERNGFDCDYQVIGDGGAVKERRIILKLNGRKMNGDTYLEESRFSVLQPILAGTKVLSTERQSLFQYRITDEGKARGRRCYQVEARPKFGNENGIELARVWVDKETSQIVRCELEGIPVEGYEDVLKDCALLNIKPLFLIRHEYGPEKNGVLFPFRSTVRVEYPMPLNLGGRVLKLTVDLRYDKHKFFTVETEDKVIK